MRKIIFSIIVLILLLTSFDFVLAQSIKAEITFFYSETCSYCLKESKFLNQLEKKYNDLVIHRYNIADKESVELLKDLYEQYQVPEEQWGMIPVTFLKEKYLIGYGGDEITGKEIENCIEECLLETGESGTDWMEAS